MAVRDSAHWNHEGMVAQHSVLSRTLLGFRWAGPNGANNSRATQHASTKTLLPSGSSGRKQRLRRDDDAPANVADPLPHFADGVLSFLQPGSRDFRPGEPDGEFVGPVW